MKRIAPSVIRQLFMLVLILFVAILIFRELTPYLTGILGAITLYVLFRKWMQKLLRKGWNKSVAAGVLIAGSFIGILMPITGIVLLLSSKIGKAVSNSEKIIKVFKAQINVWESDLGYNLSEQIDVSKLTNWLTDKLQSLAGGTFTVVIAIGIMYFLLYYMLTNRSQLRQALEDYIPLGRENLFLIGRESRAMVKANAIGIPLVAIVQGIVALIGFLVFGVPNPLFWFAVTTIGSMIPFVGTALGIVPLSILLFAQGQNWQAVAILIYGVVVVGSTDNVVRLYVLKRLSNVHPLITLIGVVVGVPLFGFIGLIFGPLLVSLFLLIVKIYKKEFSMKRNDQL